MCLKCFGIPSCFMFKQWPLKYMYTLNITCNIQMLVIYYWFDKVITSEASRPRANWLPSPSETNEPPSVNETVTHVCWHYEAHVLCWRFAIYSGRHPQQPCIVCNLKKLWYILYICIYIYALWKFIFKSLKHAARIGRCVAFMITMSALYIINII